MTMVINEIVMTMEITEIFYDDGGDHLNAVLFYRRKHRNFVICQLKLCVMTLEITKRLCNDIGDH
jgi:predicted nuclease of restriction endonuclease-like (RecB) superfamily